MAIGLISAVYCGTRLPSLLPVRFTQLSSSSCPPRIQQASYTIQPAHELQHLPNHEPLFPPHGSGNDRDALHHAPRHLRHLPQRYLIRRRALEKLGRHSLRLLPHRADP